MNKNESVCAANETQLSRNILKTANQTELNVNPEKDNQKNLIFINPRRLNTIEPPNIMCAKEKLNHINVVRTKPVFNQMSNITKVYVNPNFKRSNSSCNDNHKLQITGANSNQFLKQINSFSKVSTSKDLNLDTMNKEKLNVPETTSSGHIKGSISTGNQKIFINPNFTLKKDVDCLSAIAQGNMKNPTATTTSIGVTENPPEVYFAFQSSGSQTTCSSKDKANLLRKSNDEEVSNKKPNIYVNPDKRKIETLVSCSEATTHFNSGIKMKETSKIFINPEFNKKVPSYRFANDLKIPSLKNVEVCNMLSATENISTKQPNVKPNQSDALISNNLGLITLPIPKSVKQSSSSANSPKKLNERVRTRSTSLFAVSATKLVRRRRSIQNRPTCDLNTSTPLFLSKTKLVRKYSSRRSSSAMKLERNKNTKNVVNVGLKKRFLTTAKAHIQCLTSNKTLILRKPKQIVASSVPNVINILPISANETRVKTKNGKSLKVIRNNEMSNVATVSNRSKNESITASNAISPRQRLTKNALCVLQSKMKKNQFSKINIPTKNKSRQSFKYNNKYLNITTLNSCRPKESVQKLLPVKSLTLDNRFKSSLGKKLLGPSGKYAFNKSKYKLVRKYSNKSEIRKLSVSSSSLKKAKNQLKKENRTPKRRPVKRRELSIVNISGVFYQCSRTSLKRNKTTFKPILQIENEGPIIRIRGQKFKFENGGQTLTCLDKKPERKRIDIGGVTFISSSSGKSLKRTNYHTARSILVQARQKRISLLTRKLRKNNEPCPLFHRLGKCSGKDQGTCIRQHDPKYVQVCKKFVQGSCVDSTCPLNHTLSSHNMETCHHFLAGHCGRDNCLYPHVKVSDSAPICADFLRGYCIHGDKCDKRHRNICPSFEKGSCARGKYCLYPHPKLRSGNTSKEKNVETKQISTQRDGVVSTSSVRYFEDVNLREETDKKVEDSRSDRDDSCSEEETEEQFHLAKRPKLGRLPSYIPLTFDKSFDDSEVQKL